MQYTMDSSIHITKSNVKHNYVFLVRFYLRNSNLFRKINEFGDIIKSRFVVTTH